MAVIIRRTRATITAAPTSPPRILVSTSGLSGLSGRVPASVPRRSAKATNPAEAAAVHKQFAKLFELTATTPAEPFDPES